MAKEKTVSVWVRVPLRCKRQLRIMAAIEDRTVADILGELIQENVRTYKVV